MDLRARIEALERETASLKRRVGSWRLATYGLIVLGLAASCRVAPPTQAQAPAGGSAGQPATQDEVRTKTLNVVDSEGHPRVVLGTSGKRSVLTLMDTAARPRLSMTVLEDGTALLTATDTKDKPRAIFGVNNKQAPVVATLDADGTLNDLTED